jgi:hypothetical protein
MTGAELLDAARRTGLVVTAEGDQLVVRGRGAQPVGLLEDLRSHARDVLRLLAERCGRCGMSSRTLVMSYWGDSFCPCCCPLVATDHDSDGTWPPVPDWEGEEMVWAWGGHGGHGSRTSDGS